jgi:hypothetical protein
MHVLDFGGQPRDVADGIQRRPREAKAPDAIDSGDRLHFPEEDAAGSEATRTGAGWRKHVRDDPLLHTQPTCHVLDERRVRFGAKRANDLAGERRLVQVERIEGEHVPGQDPRGGSARCRFALLGLCLAEGCGTRTAAQPGDGGGSAPACSPASWFLEDVARAAIDSDLGRRTSIAVDASGGVHVSHVASKPGALHYAHRTPGGAWDNAVLDARGDDARTSIAVDPSGLPHISYSRNGRLHYTTLGADRAWFDQRVDDGQPSFSSSLRIDSAGVVHIGYVTNYDVRHAVLVSGTWMLELVDAIQPFGASSSASLHVDGSGGVHVAYYAGQDKFGPYVLRYAVRPAKGAKWQVDVVDGDMEGFLLPIDLGVDGDGGAHVLYGLQDYEVRYAYRPSGEWSTRRAAPSEINTFASLAVEDGGVVHLVYNGKDENYGQQMRHAHGLPTEDWVTETVGEGGYFSSVALDAAGGVHVAHQGSHAELDYAYRCP